MVMGLMAMMLGMGVGAIASIDVGTYGSGSLVRSTLRATGNWSRSRQAPARVRFDVASGAMAAEGLMVVGTWHFESMPPRGAFDLNGELLGANLVDDGFVGKALGLRGTPPYSAYEITVSNDPAFALQSGFQFQFVLRAEGPSRGTLLQLGDALKIEATRNLGLKVSMSTERFDEKTGEIKPAGKASLETPGGVLAIGEWRRVLVTYDRSALNIFVEGVREATLAEEGSVARTKSKLVLGGGQRPWSGSMDSLVVSAVGAQENVVLPEGVWFVDGTPKEIVFAADGGLDRALFKNPVSFEIEYADGRRETIRINMYGTVE